METINVSRVTCPACDYVETVSMPTDYCRLFHECARCKRLLKAKPGTCCIFCSYGDVPCPPVQMSEVQEKK